MSYLGYRVLHISFQFQRPRNVAAELEPLFAKATDWVRYAPNCWIVVIDASIEAWFNHLVPHITSNEYLFITQVQASKYSGWMPKMAIDFLAKYAG